MIELKIMTALWQTEQVVKKSEVKAIVAFYKKNYPGVGITQTSVKVLA